MEKESVHVNSWIWTWTAGFWSEAFTIELQCQGHCNWMASLYKHIGDNMLNISTLKAKIKNPLK